LIAHFMVGLISWRLESGQDYTTRQMLRRVFQLQMLGEIWALGFDMGKPRELEKN
jgi:hypothetical protein